MMEEEGEDEYDDEDMGESPDQMDAIDEGMEEDYGTQSFQK